ncbi:MAG: hypothetical protein K6B74_01150 [Ruminococcus sp.]|nr:hypothetical protein [Ruminococcus sp.]
MAYKCKSCGYRFKPSDSDLCPECFTARDDIGCESFGDGHGAHTHFKDAAGSDDFIAEQLREESRLTGAEMAEEFADFTDSVRRSLSSETPPNTYRKAPQSPRINPTYSSDRGYQSNTVQFSRYAAQSNFDLSAPEVKSVKNKGNIIAVMLILFITAPYAFYIAHNTIRDIKNDSLPAVITAEADNFTFDKKIAGCYGIDSDYSGSLSISDPRRTEYIWYGMKCDISLSDSDYTVGSITLTGFGDDEAQFTWTTENENYGSGSELHGVPLCVTPTGSYTLSLECKDSSGEIQTITQKLVLSEALAEFEKEPYTEPLDAPLYHDYNYEPGYFYSSLADEAGSGIKIRLAETPHELVDNENVGTFNFEDESLSKADMKLCRIELYLGTTPSIYTEFGEIRLAGLDANGMIAYEYSSYGDPVLPISSRVQYYELLMTVSDKEGFDRQIGYKFYSNDLYNTIDR